MKKISVDLRFDLLSPLLHFGDENMGTMRTMRTQKIFYEGEFLDCPCFSGNALRGILRRVIMYDFMEQIGLTEETITPNLYYLLFSGGSLTSGSRYEEVGERRELRKHCPPLSLLGSALESQIIQGKLKSSILMPVCRETESLTDIPSTVSFYDCLEETFHTRKDDLKNIESNVEEKEEKKKKDSPVQMKYEMQALSTGTTLVGNIILELADEVEEGCLARGLSLLQQKGIIGGKSAAGYGRVKLTYSEIGNEDLYLNHLQENKEEIKAFVRKIEENLK